MSNKAFSLSTVDEEVFALCQAEERRQIDKLRLIPSENYVSRAVMEATGSVFTNKYSEGYPGKRYYEGQQHVDAIENLAIDRACKLLAPTTPTSNRTQALRRTWPFISPF